VRILGTMLLFFIAFPLVFVRRNSLFQITIMYITMIVVIFLVFIYAPTEKVQGIVQ